MHTEAKMVTAEIQAHRAKLTEINERCGQIELRLIALDKAIKAVNNALDALHVTEQEDAEFTDAVAVQIELQRAQLQGHRDNLADEFARLTEEAMEIERIEGVLCGCHGAMDCATVA